MVRAARRLEAVQEVGGGVSGFPQSVRQLVRERAMDSCEVCWFGTHDLQFHHRRPRGMGSTRRTDANTAANCLLLCLGCHERIESHREYARQRGYLVRQYHRPREVPVSRWGNEWVLLDDLGGATPTAARP